MKKNILIAIISFSVLLTGCSKDFLNPLPSNAVADEQIFSEVEYAETALNSAYAYIGHYFSMTLGTIMSEVMGEDATMTSGSYGRPTYNWNLYSYTYDQVAASDPWWFGYSNYIWATDYKGIDAVNSIIAYAEKFDDGAKKKNLLGQAYAVRGYLYLNLVRLFAANYTVNPDGPAVILRTEPANASSEHLGRATLKEVYNQIISDLKYGIDNCSPASTDYITPKAAALLLARTYMDMGDFANAKTYAEQAAGNVFDGSNLMSKEEWRSGFKDHNAEWLWYFNYTQATANLYASIPSFYYLANGYEGVPDGGQVSEMDSLDESKGDDILDGYGTVRWTKRFRDSFEDGDCRRMFPFYMYEEDGYFTNKFGHRNGSIGDAEFPMARIAEAYLIKAECEAQIGSQATAKSVLNALQVKRGASPTEATLDNIYMERRKELYGEGFRLSDIKRLHQPLDRTKDKEHWCSVKSLPADSPRFMLPIPETEMLYNKALTSADQNEYWR